MAFRGKAKRERKTTLTKKKTLERVFKASGFKKQRKMEARTEKT